MSKDQGRRPTSPSNLCLWDQRLRQVTYPRRFGLSPRSKKGASCLPSWLSRDASRTARISPPRPFIRLCGFVILRLSRTHLRMRGYRSPCTFLQELQTRWTVLHCRSIECFGPRTEGGGRHIGSKEIRAPWTLAAHIGWPRIDHKRLGKSQESQTYGIKRYGRPKNPFAGRHDDTEGAILYCDIDSLSDQRQKCLPGGRCLPRTLLLSVKQKSSELKI